MHIMQRYFIQLSYRGTSYHGWQKQPNAPTVQGELETALSTFLCTGMQVTGCGRTDTGVHARVFFAHFDDPGKVVARDQLCYKLNALLPADIAVQAVMPVRGDAHARFSALSREYEYHMHLKKNPFAGGLSVNIHFEPDVQLMNRACDLLLSKSDFSSFAKLHTDVKTHNCKLRLARWERVGDRLVFRVRADRFLRNMVRAMVGTLLELGAGKINIEEFNRAVEAHDRSAAGMSAAAHGLFLSDVEYPVDIFL